MKLRCLRPITFAAAGVAALVGPALAEDQDFSGVSLTINGYGGTYDEILQETVAEPLRDKTGLDVRYQPSGSTAATAQLLASVHNPPYDLIMADSPAIPALIEAGVIEEISADEIPNASKIAPGLREFGDYCFPFSIASAVLVYNTEHISTAPSRFSDLADEEYAGRVALFSLQSTGGILSLMAMAEANGGSVDDIDPAFELLQKIRPNVLAAFGSTVPHLQAFQQEEASVGVFWNGRVHELQNNGVPVEMVVPEEGLYSVISYVCPVTGNSNPEAVRAYINQALSDQAIAALAEFFTYGPTTDVELDPEIAPKVVAYGEGLERVKTLDWAAIVEKRDAWTDRWNREMR